MTAKQEKFDQYYKTPAGDGFAEELDVTNALLEEIRYYGKRLKISMIKDSKLLSQVRGSELLRFDTERISKLWKDLKWRSEEIQSRIKRKHLDSDYHKTIFKHIELLQTCKKLWSLTD